MGGDVGLLWDMEGVFWRMRSGWGRSDVAFL